MYGNVHVRISMQHHIGTTSSQRDYTQRISHVASFLIVTAPLPMCAGSDACNCCGATCCGGGSVCTRAHPES